MKIVRQVVVAKLQRDGGIPLIRLEASGEWSSYLLMLQSHKCHIGTNWLCMLRIDVMSQEVSSSASRPVDFAAPLTVKRLSVNYSRSDRSLQHLVRFYRLKLEK